MNVTLEQNNSDFSSEIHIFLRKMPSKCHPQNVGQYVQAFIHAIWRPRSEPKLAQVTAKCLAAPIHSLNQCWLLISEGFFAFSSAISQRVPKRLSYISPRGQWHKMTEISQIVALRNLSWTKYVAFWGKFVVFSRKVMTLFTWHIYVSLGLKELALIFLSHCNYCPICTVQIQKIRSNDQHANKSRFAMENEWQFKTLFEHALIFSQHLRLLGAGLLCKMHVKI